ncbi:MAG: hypothetical protein AAFQ13_02255 [Pseudomonadota bacterium]
MPSFFIGCVLLAVPAVQPSPVKGRIAAPDTRTSLEARGQAERSAFAPLLSAAPKQRPHDALGPAVHPASFSNRGAHLGVEVPSGAIRPASINNQSDETRNGAELYASDEAKGIDQVSHLRGEQLAPPMPAGTMQAVALSPEGLEYVDAKRVLAPEIPHQSKITHRAARRSQRSEAKLPAATAYVPLSPSLRPGKGEGRFGEADQSGLTRVAVADSNSDITTSSGLAELSETQSYGTNVDSEAASSGLKTGARDVEPPQVEDTLSARNSGYAKNSFKSLPSELSLGLEQVEIVQPGDPEDATLVEKSDNKPADIEAYSDGVVIENQIAAQSRVSLLASLPSAEGSPAIAETGGTSKVIHLRKLVELLGDRFAPDELERLQNSPAIDTDLPIRVLEQSGISLASLPAVDASMVPLVALSAPPNGSEPGSFTETIGGAEESPVVDTGIAVSTSQSSSGPTGEMSPSITEHGGGTQVVRLKALVELIDDRFAPEELERLQTSPAIDTQLPVHVLEQSGISLASLPGAETLAASAESGPEVVPLENLVELVGNRFTPDELERLQSSPAIKADVPVHVLERSGISLGSLPGALVAAPLASMQAAGNRGGPATPSGSGGGALGGLGLSSTLAVTASAGFESDPFLSDFEDTSAPLLRLEVAPTISSQTERTTVRLTGRAEHIEYLETYDSVQNLYADLTATHLANERLEIQSGLFFSSNVPATNIADPSVVDDTFADASPGSTGNDITVLGQRQNRFGANAGLIYTLSERDQLRWSLTGEAQRFDTDELSETNSFGQRLEYLRMLDEGLSIGASVDTNLIEFSAPLSGDSRIISPQVQVNAALTPRLELAGSVGVSFNRIDIGGLEETSTTLAGSVSLCNTDERSSLCLNGSRQVLPAAIGGATLQTNAGVSYSLRISERDTLQFDGSYGTSDASRLADQAQNFENVNASVRYQRRLNDRLRLFVSGNYLKNSGDVTANSTNVGAVIGITFDLGRPR